MNTKSVTIIVPIYADWDSLKNCISSVKKYVDPRHKIILVNDYGPQAKQLEQNIRQATKGHRNFHYFKNTENLGFVGTCNKAVMELDKTENDILILTSDTEATKGFLEEMLYVLNSDDKIGAVSPRSNNATIATVPLSAAPQKGLDPKMSYQLFQKIKKRLPRYNDIPTVHGFCMLVKRKVIEKFGLFDEIYGKGYGEENDFSMRIRQGGY